MFLLHLNPIGKKLLSYFVPFSQKNSAKGHLVNMCSIWRYDIQHNDIPHNGTQHNDIQHNSK
jgi:hypothetical protein